MYDFKFILDNSPQIVWGSIDSVHEVCSCMVATMNGNLPSFSAMFNLSRITDGGILIVEVLSLWV